MSRVLIIDDDPQIREVLRITFENDGFQVAEAGDGNEGIARYHQFLPDLVITDILMPEKEGLETIRELRNSCPDVKIIAISGGTRAIEKNDLMHIAELIGAGHTFTKPFDRKRVLHAARRLLNTASD